MSLRPDDLLKELVKHDYIKELKASYENSVKYGTLVGVATVISGLFFGPRGLAIGAAVSGCAASYASHGQFKSVSYILLYEITPQQKTELAQKLYNLVTTRNIKTLEKFKSLICTNNTFLEAVTQILIMFLAKMNYQLHV